MLYQALEAIQHNVFNLILRYMKKSLHYKIGQNLTKKRILLEKVCLNIIFMCLRLNYLSKYNFTSFY